jgi:TP901 family phage tail tape measure protein
MAVTINVQASQTALAQSIAAGVAAYNARFAAQNQLNLQFNPQSFTQPLGRINGDLKQFQSALAASNARVLAFGASTAVIGGVAKSFKELATATIDVEKALVDINRVLSLSSSGLQKFSSDLFGVAKATASSFKDASDAALEFSRQGLSTEQTLQRVSDALTLVRLTGVSAKQAVEDLTAVTNAYAQTSLDTTTILNKIVAVEQQFAVSAADLTSAVSRTGQAAQEAGVNFDQLNALVTATQEKTARGGAVIGNALKTIFTRLQRTETLDQLENFNVAVRDIQGNVLPAVQILQNLAQTYNTLADTTKSSLAEQVAGVYQVNILKSLLSDLNDQQGSYNKALEIGVNATNEAQQANAALNVTLAALISQTGTNLQQLSNNIGKVTFEPVFKSLISPFNDAVTYINDLLEGEGLGSDFANGLLKGIKNVLGGPVLLGAAAIITKVIGNTFRDISTAVPTLLGITTQAQKRKDVEESILKILQTQSNTAQALIGNSGNLAAQQQVLLNLATYQTAQYQQQLNIAKQLAPLLVGQNVQVGSAGLQVGRITASGYIPSYSAGYIPPSVRSKEIQGSLLGGYQPGTVVPSPVGGVMNTAERVKYVPNFVQPFINPPLNSPAGIAHRENSIRQTGINPYQARGFIPNFAGGAGLFKSWIRTQPGGEAFLASANLSDINWYRENAEAVLQLRNYLDQYNKANPEAQYSVAKLKDFDVQSQNLGKKADLEAKLGKTFTTTRRGESISGVPETPQAAPSFNAATLVTRMQSRKSFAEAYPDLQKILNDPNASEKEKNAADQIINDNLGQAYEAFGLQHLKQIGYPKAVTAESLNLAGSPKTTAIDAVDFPSQTFFEFKGGEVDPENITSKFIRARTDEGNFEKLFQGKTGKPWIETADENDRALGKAWTRDASVFDSLFKKYTSQAWQNVLVANDYGKATKSGNKVVYFNPVDSATPGLYLMEYFKELKGIGEPYAYYKQSIAAEDIPSLLAKESERVKSFFPFQTDADFKKFIADNRGQAPQKAATAGAIAQAVQNIAKQKPSNLRPPINWVYDSDVFGGSYGEKFDNLKNIILNDPSIVKDILVAPAGAGKTTYAAKLGYKPITNFEDIHEGDRVLLLSASRLSKEGGFSTYFQQQLDAVNKTGGKKFFGELPNELITQRRQLRAQSGVARGLNAPLRESDFEQMLMSQGFKSLSLASNGFIPNFASRSEMIRDLIRFNLESTPDVKDKNVFGSKTTLFRGVKNRGGRYSGSWRRDIFEQSNNYSQAKNSFDYFIDTDINKIAHDHITEKKLLPFVSASTDEDIAKYFARGRQDSDFSDEGKVGSKTIKNSRIFSAESIRKFISKYGQKALKQLMMEHSTWGSFGLGKGIAMNFQSFSDKKGFEGTDFAKEISFLSNGFIPNFASENAIRTMQEIIARAEGSNDPRLINEANVAKEKLKKLTGSEGGINFLNSISDIDVPELDLQSQLNNIRVAYTDTKGEMRRGTAPLSSLEQIIQVLRQKRHKEISILGAGLPGIKERLAALGIKDSEYQVSGGYEYFPLNQFGGFIPNFAKLGLNNQRLTQYDRFSKTVKNLKNQQAYKGKVQDEGKIIDQLTIPNIQVEKLNVDSNEFRRAAKRTKELRSEISKAIQAEGKAFETGIKKKYPQLKFTSNNEEIKFGSSSALDFVGDKTVVEAKAGNYNFQNVEEKFFRFPFENINNPNISKDIAPQFWSDKADNVKLYQNEILKLITAPESIDKESLYRIPAGARKQTAIENMAANMGFIPNFANAIALNKRYEFDGKYDSLNGKKRFNDFVKANSTDNIIPAFVGPNGVFYHHSIPSHEGLVRQFGLTAYDLENSIKAFIQNGVLTIPNLEETFQMQGKLRSQSLIDYAAKSTRNHLKESGLTNIIEKTKKNEKNVFFKELPQSEVFAAFNSLKNASWNDFSEEKTYQKIESLPLDKAREIIGLLEAKMDNRIGDFVPDNNTAQAQKNFISDVARVKADLQQILQEKEKASQELKKLKGQFGIGAGFSGASSFSKGFIPNFATGYLSDVMSLESNLSNNTAVLDTTTGPYPFIRNTSQPNFAAAISDHGGEKKALKDSITNQTNAGLLSSRGMIPNFAPPPSQFQISGIQQGVGGTLITNNQKQVFQTAIDNLINQFQATTQITSIQEADQAFASLATEINNFITANGLDAASAKDIATQVQAYTRNLATQAKNLQTQNQLSITNKQNEYTVALEKLQSTLRRLNTDLLLSDDEIKNLRTEVVQLVQTLDTTAQEISQLTSGAKTPQRPTQTTDRRGNLIDIMDPSGSALNAQIGRRGALDRLNRGVSGMSNNLALTFGVPLVAGQLQQAIVGNTERFQQTGVQRFANEAVGSGFTNIQTGAMIGTALTPILGPFGPLIGAASGALVTFGSALLKTSDTLEDLQKAAQDLAQKNKADVDAVKNLIQLQQQIGQETDPYKIKELSYQIEDTVKGIQNARLQDEVIAAGVSIKNLNEAIDKFTTESRQREKIANIASKAKQFEQTSGLDTFQAAGILGDFGLYFDSFFDTKNFQKRKRDIERNTGFQLDVRKGDTALQAIPNLLGILPGVGGNLAEPFSFDFDKNRERLAKVFSDFTDPFFDLEEKIKNIAEQPKKQNLLLEFDKAIATIDDFTTEADIRKKFQIFVDEGLVTVELINEIAAAIDNQIENSLPGKSLLQNFKQIIALGRGGQRGKKTSAETAKQAGQNLRKFFANINLEVSRANFEIDTQIKEFEFSKEIGSLNLDKTSALINQAFAAISKNIDDNLRPSIDKFINDLNVAQQQAVLSLEARVFPQIQIQNLKKARQQNVATISQFLEKESQPGQIPKIQSVFDKLNTGNLDEAITILNTINLKNAQNSEIEKASAIEKLRQTQQQADLDSQLAKERFDTAQFWSNKQIELLKKIGEEEFKLSQIKLANAQKEKELIQSITFEGAKRQITGQGEIERKQLEMERPFRLLGRGEFGVQDENFRIQQEIFEKQQKLAIDQALNDAAIADVQRQVLESNTNATAENTKAIYESIARKNLEKQLVATDSIAQTGNQIKNKESLLNRVNRDIIVFNDQKKLDTQISETEEKLKKQQTLLSEIPTVQADYDRESKQAITNYLTPSDLEKANTENRNRQTEKLKKDIEKTELELKKLLKQKEVTPRTSQDYEQLQAQKTSLEGQITALKTEKSNQEADLQSLKKAAEKLPTVSAVSGVKSNLTQLPPGLNLNESLAYLQNQRSEQERILEGYQAQEDQLKDRKAKGEELSIAEENKLVSLRGQIINQQRVVNDLKLNELKTTEAIATNEERIKNNQLARAKRGKFLTGVQEGFQEIVTQSQNFEQNFGKTAVFAFRDGLTGAIDAAMNKTDDLGAALMEVASGFLRTMQQALNQQIANNLVMGIGSAFPSATGINAQSFARRRGGIIRAQNGIYVPSMAGGNGMGIQDRGRTGDVNPALLEDGEYVLNRNAVDSLGGPSVLDNLNFRQFPRFADGGQNTGSLSGSANFTEPFSQLSEFGKSQSPEYQDYLGKLRDQWEKDQAKKKQRQAFINQLIMTGISAGFTAGLGSLSSAIASSGSMTKTSVLGTKMDAGRLDQVISMRDTAQRGGLMRFASGGYLPYGNRLNDTIPALLSGGEYIVNSRAVRKYGVGGMNRINSGIARFEDGGMVGDAANQNNTPGNVESSNTNNVSINITVNANGSEGSSEQTNSTDKQQSDNANLGRRIKEAVLQVIVDEQRSGGLLDSTKKK